MKKTEKRVLGLLGLILVAITTIFAAFLPGPEASATDSGTSVTDTIQVRVVGNSPAVEIVGVTDGEKVVFPDLSFNIKERTFYVQGKNIFSGCRCFLLARYK